MTDDRKQKLLDHYADKPIQRFLQIDASHEGVDDSVVMPDNDGDVVFTAVRDELQTSSWDVRLRIPEGANPEDVCRLLHKVICYLETDGKEALAFEFTDHEGEPVPEEEIREHVFGAGSGQFSRLTGGGTEGEYWPGWYESDA